MDERERRGEVVALVQAAAGLGGVEDLLFATHVLEGAVTCISARRNHFGLALTAIQARACAKAITDAFIHTFDGGHQCHDQQPSTTDRGQSRE